MLLKEREGKEGGREEGKRRRRKERKIQQQWRGFPVGNLAQGSHGCWGPLRIGPSLEDSETDQGYSTRVLGPVQLQDNARALKSRSKSGF